MSQQQQFSIPSSLRIALNQKGQKNMPEFIFKKNNSSLLNRDVDQYKNM